MGKQLFVTAADGSAFVVMTTVPTITRDQGKTWAPVRGLPICARVVADRMDPRRFYALDFEHGSLFVSTDGATTFAVTASSGLLANMHDDHPRSAEPPWPLSATLGHVGDL